MRRKSHMIIGIAMLPMEGLLQSSAFCLLFTFVRFQHLAWAWILIYFGILILFKLHFLLYSRFGIGVMEELD